MQIDLSKPFFRAHGLPRSRPILESWARVCRRYRDRADAQGDRVCYYNERAQTGFLAAATWLSGGVALEEWCTEKRSKDGHCRKGRGDLWLQRKNLRLHIEAKHAWIGLGSQAEANIQKVKAKLAKAQGDACDISCSRRERRVGVLFAVPIVRRAAAADAEHRLKQWIAGLQNLDCLALAAAFDPAELDRSGTDELVLGIALLIGRATRSPR